jgi:DNA-binding NarL/FixJ family response regulator
MQRFTSDRERTEELAAQVAQLRRELEEANAAARKRTEELTAQVAQLRRELEATWAIKRESPVTSVVVETIHENPDYLFEALKAGAAGYVLKDATQEEVIIAVLQVIGGESPLNPALVNQPAKQPGGEQNEERPRGGPPSEGSKESPESLQRFAAGLTEREIEVVRLLAQGHTNREIAQELVISSGTVKVHVQRIIRKLCVSDRNQAAEQAIELGLVSPKSGWCKPSLPLDEYAGRHIFCRITLSPP